MANLKDTIIDGDIIINGEGKISNSPLQDNDIVNKLYIDNKFKVVESLESRIDTIDNIYVLGTILCLPSTAASVVDSTLILNIGGTE